MAETNADPAPAPVPKGILLKADSIAEPFLAEVKANLAAVLSASSSRGPPKLVGILATASAAPSRSYAEFTRKQCTALGIAFELREVDQDDGVEEAIIEANADSSVDGIMVRLTLSRSSISSQSTIASQVYYPIFGKEQVRFVSCSCYDTHYLPNCTQQDHYLQQIVSPFKDVEGLNYKFHYNLYHK
jgi:methylenetetrahydrofolate dehydrogenase (NAD+)